MKELDFDELDRAVNSLMTDVPKGDIPADEQEKTLTITPSSTGTPPPSPAVATTTVTPDAVNVTKSTPAVTRTSSPAPLASRRGGRFMDVVHPSSNMKKAESPRPVSRQGVTIAPDNPSVVAGQPTTSPASTEPDVPAKAPDTSTTAAEPAAAASEWPDPLELAEFKDGQAKTTGLPDSLDTSADTAVPTPEIPDEPSPLTSPFLPGTKVEKRPLGGAVTADETAPPSGSGQEKLTADDPSDQLPATPPAEVESPLPEELQGDLVAIESGAAGGPTADKPKEETVAAPDAEPAALLPKAATPEPKTQPPVPTGPVSIPQQYREEPSTGESANGSIYDTDAYHQPLAHPGRKKSGWLWVVWIVLILLAGAGAGAALHFLGII